MLVIRQNQMEILGRASRDRFDRELAELFLSTYPREARQAGGEKQFVRGLRENTDRALSLGFTAPKQATLFVALTLMLGYDFYTDPQLPWAWQLIAPGNNNIRINAVYDAAVAYLQATAGQDCEFVVRALVRIRSYNLHETPRSAGDAFDADVLSVLQRFCPEKYAFQGEDLNRELVAHARKTAAKYGITANSGVLLLTTLMFMLGSGIDHDPVHPWASRALTDSAPGDQSARIDLLYRAAMDHTTQSLQPDEELLPAAARR